jgi:RNA polymerase sigma-70 factor (ECF subfamily)
MESGTAPLPAPAAEPDDLAVVEEVKRGNREVFEVLVRRHNQRLYRVGMSYLRRPDQVEDAMQNTYLKAFLHLGRFEGTSAFATWITRIMINECLALLRKRNPAGVTGDEELAMLESPAPEDHVARLASLQEIKSLLEEAIRALPPRYRVVYMLREVQQLDTQETARSVGITTEAVRVRLHRARELMKDRLLATAAGVELFSFGSAHCACFTQRVMTRILAA